MRFPFLAKAIKSKGMTLRTFGERTGMSASALSRTIRGDRRSRAKHDSVRIGFAERFRRWADALELHGVERDRFIEDCWLATSPDFIKKLVSDLRRKLESRGRRR